MLYSAGSGVNKVEVDLSALSIRSFSCVHLYISWRYGWRFDCAVSMFEWEDSAVMSSAYVSRSTVFGGVGMSDIYMLKRVGDRTPP